MIDELRKAYPQIDWAVKTDVEAPDNQDVVAGHSSTIVAGPLCGFYKIIVGEDRGCFSAHYSARLEWVTGVLLGSMRDDPVSAVVEVQALLNALQKGLMRPLK